MKTKYLYCLLFILTAVIFTSCSSDNPVAPNAAPGLQVSTPENQNVDSGYLDRLADRISGNYYGRVKSLLITRNNFLIYEKYFRGESRESLHRIYSVTKSITSAMVGILIQRGLIPGPDKKLLDYFTAYNIQNNDPSKGLITIGNTLSMTSGLQWNELSVSYASASNDYFQMFSSSDPIKYVLDKPMQETPGSRFRYNTGLTFLFSSIIQTVTGDPAEKFAKENIFDPLGITDYSWTTATGGLINTGSGLSMRSIDMVLFGQLYLNRGYWNGRQIVPADWVDRSTKNNIQAGSNYDYGYFWWRFSDSNPVISSLPENDIYMAIGYGDQYIFVLPEYRIIIVITADNGETNYQINNILSDYIFPAIKDK